MRHTLAKIAAEGEIVSHTKLSSQKTKNALMRWRCLQNYDIIKEHKMRGKLVAGIFLLINEKAAWRWKINLTW